MRYIDADALIQDFDNDVHCLRLGGMKGTPRPLDISLKNVIERIEEAPTEDVVPRAEVEELQKRLADYERVVGKLSFTVDGAVILVGDETEYIPKSLANGFKNLAVKQAKQEVAREIFEVLAEVFLTIPLKDGGKATIVDFKRYAELKKKYIGE